MNRTLHTVAMVGAIAMLFTCGCHSHSPDHHSSPNPPPMNMPIDETPHDDNPESSEPRVSDQPYQGPPVKVSMLALQTYPEQNVVNVEITTNTGGWSLALDRGDVVNGTAKVYLTLERPGEGEIVTQALEKHAASFSTTKKFTQAKVYIHLAQRGVSTLTTDYRLAATAK